MQPDIVCSRITEMESYLDAVREAMEQNPKSWWKDAVIREKLRILADYYENGQWLADYERDERGELPLELKRGVLSQDALYDLLEEAASVNESSSKA